MTCKDCAHYDICLFHIDEETEMTVNECEHFKDKARFVELPCKVGDTVYYIFANKIFKKRVTQYIEILRKSEMVDKWYGVNFSENKTFEDEDIGKTVFLTREEAEEKLKETKG